MQAHVLIRFRLDTSIRAIGTRAHAMHSLAFFSFYSIIVSTVGWVHCLFTPEVTDPRGSKDVNLTYYSRHPKTMVMVRPLIRHWN